MPHAGPLVSAAWLERHLGDPAVVVVDCRFSPLSPAAGRQAYARGHIPGAVFLDVDRDLSAPPGPGRHPLPAPERFARAAAAAGIGAGSVVVAYDEQADGGAARLWWLLRHFGHPAAAVLDGGLRGWREAGGAIDTAPPPARPAVDPFVPRARVDDTIEADELMVRQRDERLLVIDARAPERFRGDVEPLDPLAGHIPGAVNLPFGEVSPGGRYRSPAELRALLSGDSDRERAAYCGSGVTAATVVLAAELAGLPPVRLYPGSWSEWSRRGLPAEPPDR